MSCSGSRFRSNSVGTATGQSRSGMASLGPILFGALLGAGLLTKAYVLAFIPLLIVVALIRIMRACGARQSAAGLVLGLTLPTTMAGSWYWRTWQSTSTLSGEQIDVAAARFTVAEKLAAARKVDWIVALDELAFSHIWIGAWSFSGIRSWMYRVFELIAAAAFGFIWLCVRIGARSWRECSLGLLGCKSGSSCQQLSALLRGVGLPRSRRFSRKMHSGNLRLVSVCRDHAGILDDCTRHFLPGRKQLVQTGCGYWEPDCRGSRSVHRRFHSTAVLHRH